MERGLLLANGGAVAANAGLFPQPLGPEGVEGEGSIAFAARLGFALGGNAGGGGFLAVT